MKGMSGHMFECYGEQNDRRQYARTSEALDAYVKRNMSYAADLAPLFAAKMKPPAVGLPTDIAAGSGELAKLIFAEEVKTCVKGTRALTSYLPALSAVIWGQCSKKMKAQVQTHKGHTNRAVDNNCVWLMQQIKSVTLQFNESKNGFLSLHDAQQCFLKCRQ